MSEYALGQQWVRTFALGVWNRMIEESSSIAAVGRADRIRDEQKSDVRRERVFVALFLFFTLLTLSHFVHDQWFALDPAPRNPAVHEPIFTSRPQGGGYAPNIYRVGAPFVSRVVLAILPVHWSRAFALMDMIFGFIGMWSMYRVLTDERPDTHSPAPYRSVLVVAFLAAIALPLNFVVPWQRPETMPSACFLGLATWAMIHLRGRIIQITLPLLTLMQALTRSDVAIMFAAAVLLLGIFAPRTSSGFASRRIVLMMGTALLIIAAGTQAYLQFIAYPHVPYPPGAYVVQLPFNFSAHNLNAAALVLAPTAVALVLGAYLRQSWLPTDKLAMLAAMLFLPVWYLVGSTAESRIYVPFLLLLCVPVARVIAHALTHPFTNRGQDA